MTTPSLDRSSGIISLGEIARAKSWGSVSCEQIIGTKPFTSFDSLRLLRISAAVSRSHSRRKTPQISKTQKAQRRPRPPLETPQFLKTILHGLSSLFSFIREKRANEWGTRQKRRNPFNEITRRGVPAITGSPVRGGQGRSNPVSAPLRRALFPGDGQNRPNSPPILLPLCPMSALRPTADCAASPCTFSRPSNTARPPVSGVRHLPPTAHLRTGH